MSFANGVCLDYFFPLGLLVDTQALCFVSCAAIIGLFDYKEQENSLIS